MKLKAQEESRGHTFATEVEKRLLAERFEGRARPVVPKKNLYDGIPCVTMCARLSDKAVREEGFYQTDLLCMPMLDSAENNVFLERKACGTPVMTNRVGGVPEYVPGDFNEVMPVGADADDWAAQLTQIAENRERLDSWRPAARHWAEGLDWKIVAEEYRALYREVERMT